MSAFVLALIVLVLFGIMFLLGYICGQLVGGEPTVGEPKPLKRLADKNTKWGRR